MFKLSDINKKRDFLYLKHLPKYFNDKSIVHLTTHCLLLFKYAINLYKFNSEMNVRVHLSVCSQLEPVAS